ncbi:MAG: tRNA-(ms[2]io[6]A)-hydroxylase [Myxococcota bacterium]|jgi:tRNA-(ms[2]io[6]A)-hydroxylase|nr:tRNA-(ms[2]io[6]A)-hydroxylase [Myxococcota bacterium]
MLALRFATPTPWLDAVLADFDAFLLDHAAAERKASAVALSLISHYPDREALVAVMMDIAREELEHFYQVYKHLVMRGLTLAKDIKDPYVGALRERIRRGREAYFLDRLLIGGIVEARGCERFGMIAEGIGDDALAEFYRVITASEARHDEAFIRLAREYFPDSEVDARLDALLDEEAEIVAGLEIRAALH